MTYAIFRAAGFQYRAEPGAVLRLPTLDAEPGKSVTFDEVLLGATNGETLIGRPTLEGASVRAEVLGHGRADKIVVFKLKRRKNYRRKAGHRQGFTDIRVSNIELGGGRAPTVEPAPKPKTKVKKAAKPTAKATTQKTPTAKAKTAAKAKSTSRSKKKKSD